MVRNISATLIRYWRLIFLAGLLLLPFVYWIPARVAFEIPRVWWVLLWVELLIFLSLPMYGGRAKLSKPLSRMYLLVFGVMVIASLFGVNTLKSLSGNYYRLDGLVTYLHVWLLAFMVGWYASESTFTRALYGLAMVNIFLSILAIFQGIWQEGFLGMGLWDGQVGLMFGNPNFLAGFLTISYPSVIFLLRKEGKKLSIYSKIFLSVLPLAAMLFTGSRGAFLSMGLLWVYILTKLMSKKSIHIISIMVGLVILSWGVWQFFEDSKNPAIEFASQSRERIVRNMWLGYLQEPWFGYGWANAGSAFEKGGWPYVVRFDVVVDKAHGLLLEYLVTTGLIGFCIYLVFLGTLIRRVLKKNTTLVGETLAMVVGVYLLFGQMNVLSIGVEVLFSLAVGYLLQES